MESRVSELKKVREKLESGQTLEFQEKRLLCNELMTREPRMEKTTGRSCATRSATESSEERPAAYCLPES